uniref:Secreted protein n=1 Tax=Phaselicystis flava TaxID=525924 RepID=A0A3S7V085_9BACT|nr:secreted protein [Phaselicystis flava]
MLFMLRAAASPRDRLAAPATASLRRVGRVSRAAALLAAALAFAPATLRAETGSPLPQGYTTDIPNAPAAPPSPAAPSAMPVQQIDEAEPAADEFADNDPSALTDFNEPLAPYGTWVDDASYGTVWVPSATVVGADFAPYQTAGHWTMADGGDWMWVSDYDWGYIPFHYGRWVWIAGRGWAWIPGRTYAPAWVVWRVGDGGYLGWAPMPPTWYWSGGVSVGLWTTPVAAYCFVPTAYVFHHHVHTYVVRDHVVVRQARGGHAHVPRGFAVGQRRAEGRRARQLPPRVAVAARCGRPGVGRAEVVLEAGSAGARVRDEGLDGVRAPRDQRSW